MVKSFRSCWILLFSSLGVDDDNDLLLRDDDANGMNEDKEYWEIRRRNSEVTDFETDDDDRNSSDDDDKFDIEECCCCIDGDVDVVEGETFDRCGTTIIPLLAVLVVIDEDEEIKEFRDEEFITGDINVDGIDDLRLTERRERRERRDGK
jgi:hypothetical protein